MSCSTVSKSFCNNECSILQDCRLCGDPTLVHRTECVQNYMRLFLIVILPVILIILAIIIVVFFCVRRRRRRYAAVSSRMQQIPTDEMAGMQQIICAYCQTVQNVPIGTIAVQCGNTMCNRQFELTHG